MKIIFREQNRASEGKTRLRKVKWGESHVVEARIQGYDCITRYQTIFDAFEVDLTRRRAPEIAKANSRSVGVGFSPV